MRKIIKKHRDHLNGRRISDILEELADEFKTPDITIGELKEALPGRVFGIFLIILALPNLVPIPAPGLSALLGAPLLLLTFQMMLGKKNPWLPQFLTLRSFKTEQLRSIFKKIMPTVKKWERVTTPRLLWLFYSPADRIISFFCVILSVLIMLPIPFGNALPALAICFFAIAFLQRDGFFIILGLITGIMSGLLVSASIVALMIALENILFL